CSWVRVFSTTSSRKTLVMAMGWDVAGTSSVATSDTETTACMMESNSPAKRSISSSVSWIRARSARRATSSRPIEGMVLILGRGSGPRAHPVVVAADAPEAEAPVEGACGGVVGLDLEQGTAGALHGGERQQGGRDGPAESPTELAGAPGQRVPRHRGLLARRHQRRPAGGGLGPLPREAHLDRRRPREDVVHRPARLLAVPGREPPGRLEPVLVQGPGGDHGGGVGARQRPAQRQLEDLAVADGDRKSTRLNSSHV